MLFMMSWDSKADSALSPETALGFFPIGINSLATLDSSYGGCEHCSQNICPDTLKIKKHFASLFKTSQVKDGKEITPKCKFLDANNSFNCILGKLTYLEKATETLYFKKWHYEKAGLLSSVFLTL